MNLNDALILLVAGKLELLETMECLHLSRVKPVVTILANWPSRVEINNPFRTSPFSRYQIRGVPKITNKTHYTDLSINDILSSESPIGF
jgi:hypothetical protein